MKRICMLLAVAFLMATGAFAQVPVQGPGPVFLPPGAAGDTMFFQGGPAGSIGKNLIYNLAVSDSEVIKSAPYSANAVTESTQVLADGNRISNKASTFIARDSEGRTRRDMPRAIGSLPVDELQIVLINDPVSNLGYMLNQKEKTVDIVKRDNGRVVFKSETEQKAGTEAGDKVKITAPIIRERVAEINTNQAGGPAATLPLPQPAGGVFRVDLRGDVKHEDLGTQVIEGVSCTGVRETRTIAAGAIGNERPLEIISETWKSPELKVVVLSKHSDPRFGETVYQLTDIKRSEPDPSLFQVPSDYRVLGQDAVASPKQ